MFKSQGMGGYQVRVIQLRPPLDTDPADQFCQTFPTRHQCKVHRSMISTHIPNKRHVSANLMQYKGNAILCMHACLLHPSHNYLHSCSFIQPQLIHQNLRFGALVLTKNGLGISSLSGSQIGGSWSLDPTFSAIRAAKARPLGSGLRFPSPTGRPPARA